MHDNTFYSIIWVCLLLATITVTGSTLYYHLQTPSYNEVVLQLVEDHGINPMVFECMNRNWNIVSEYEICKIVAQDPNITKEALARGLAD